MLDPKFFRDLQVIAMYNVEAESFSLFYRRVCRWYSREFHTPLYKVEELGPDHVLLTYFEEKFYDLYNSPSEEHLEKYNEHREILLMNEKELAEFRASQEMEEQDLDQWEQELLEQVKKEEKNKNNAKRQADKPDVPASFSVPKINEKDQDIEIPPEFSLGGEGQDDSGGTEL